MTHSEGTRNQRTDVAEPPIGAAQRADGADTGLLWVGVSRARVALVVTLRGDADMSTEQTLREALQKVTSDATEPIVVDLSGLDFCDVRGLTALLVAHTAAAKRGVAFALAGMPALAGKVWRIAFVDNLPAELRPPAYPDLRAALDAVTASTPAATGVQPTEGATGVDGGTSRPAVVGAPTISDPLRERARLAAVRRYDILDTPPDGAFDKITALAARLFGVPIAIVSIVDADRIWFKSHHGLAIDQIDRDPGLCASAILSDGPWLVEDAATDARTLANPLVAGDFGLRFYAGVPLTTLDGHNLGTLCVIDRQPRAVSEQEVATLSDLASLVMSELELRRSARRTLAETNDARRRAQRISRALQESLLPPRLPEVAGLELVARYHAANHDLVGGDFYDVIATRSGCVAVSGDVSGKGTTAAARTAEARWTLHALILDMAGPAVTLRRLNELLTRTDDDPGRSCTMALASLLPRLDAGFDVTVSLAGHPRPLLVRHGGAVEAVGGEAGPALGWLDEPAFADDTTRLDRGDLLVMFTDGLVEAIAGHGNADDTAVRDLLQPLAGNTANAVANRVDAVVTTSVLRDDAAFLVIRAT